jgi:hypothetical protein
LNNFIKKVLLIIGIIIIVYIVLWFLSIIIASNIKPMNPSSKTTFGNICEEIATVDDMSTHTDFIIDC